MRCLSLCQPYATLVAIGAKRIETRSWTTTYRGPLAIHASKRLPAAMRALLDREPFRSALTQGGVQIPGSPTPTTGTALPLGAIVAIARLVDVVPTDVARADAIAWEELPFGDFAPGRYAWYLDEVRALPTPIPCRGALGLWRPPPGVLASLVEV